MSEVSSIKMSGYHVFNPEYPEADPNMRQFYEEIRRRVDEIVSEYGGYDAISNLPTKEQTELRNRLLNFKMTLAANGEIV